MTAARCARCEATQRDHHGGTCCDCRADEPWTVQVTRLIEAVHTIENWIDGGAPLVTHPSYEHTVRGIDQRLSTLIDALREAHEKLDAVVVDIDRRLKDLEAGGDLGTRLDDIEHRLLGIP